MYDLERILQELAQNEGTTPNVVYQDIQHAIDIGFDSPDPHLQAAWRKIPIRGTRPTPEDVFSHLLVYLS